MNIIKHLEKETTELELLIIMYRVSYDEKLYNDIDMKINKCEKKCEKNKKLKTLKELYHKMRYELEKMKMDHIFSKYNL